MPVNFTEVKEKIIKPGLGITPPEVDAKKERIQDRGERSKVWDLDGNKRRCIVGIKALHYRDNPLDTNEQFKDIDLTLLSDKSCHKTQYDIQVYDDKVGFSYNSKRGGRLDFELLEIGGVAVDNGRFNIAQDGNQLFWNNVADDIDIKVMLRPQSAELYKQLKTATASKTFKWRVQHWKDSKCDFGRELSGIDSTLIAGHLEINTIVTLDSEEVDKDIYTFEEEWTGRLSRVVDLETRIKEWKTDPVYPVMIDAVVNEEITANADDGQSNIYGWYPSRNSIIIRTPNTENAGLRFASVGIPQGATITSATLGLDVKYCSGGGGNPKVYFSNADNPNAFAGGDRPKNMPNKIPAGGIVWALGTTNNTMQYKAGLVSPIQSIVSRTGWASGAIRLGLLSNLAGGAFMNFYDYQKTGQLPAQLDITYSVGAPTGQAFRLRAIEKYFMPIFDNITGKIKEIGQYIRGMIKGKKSIIGGHCARSLSS